MNNYFYGSMLGNKDVQRFARIAACNIANICNAANVTDKKRLFPVYNLKTAGRDAVIRGLRRRGVV
jgi:hypothetical protein